MELECSQALGEVNVSVHDVHWLSILVIVDGDRQGHWQTFARPHSIQVMVLEEELVLKALWAHLMMVASQTQAVPLVAWDRKTC